jgi:hypothetical protein
MTDTEARDTIRQMLKDWDAATPEQRAEALEQAAAGAAAAEAHAPGWCDLHHRLACTLCDECGHEQAQHINGHDKSGGDAEFVFANATCWAESICRDCVAAA